MLSFADQPGFRPISEGLELLRTAELIVGHNCIRFDIPAIKKLYPEWKPQGTVHDTMTLARFLWAHIEESDWGRVRAGKLPAELVKTHKLEAWGYRLGVLKGAYGKQDGAWEQWSLEMQRYCENDTLVGKTLYVRCMETVEAQGCSHAVEIEHELAWYLAQMERNGVPFNMDKAIELFASLSARREEIAVELRKEFGWWYVPNGVTDPKRNNKKQGVFAGCPYTKLKVVEFNPGSRAHIARVLKLRYGWEPEEFTDGGQPKVDETTLEKLEHIPAAAKVIEFLVITKLIGQLAGGKKDKEKAWMSCATNSGAEGGLLTGAYHIHGSINQNGAVTHRASHSFPNLAQVPKVMADKNGWIYGYAGRWGAECRSLFNVPDGWVMIGADASGLELRCLAHFMARYDDGAYGNAILEGNNEDGTDIHSVNRNALGLEGREGRDKAKTFIYAWLYGAGDWKIGHTLNPLLSDDEKVALGKRKKREFLKNTPALRLLAEAVKEKVATQKYINMPDGRRSYIRHAHAALNTLLQGAGAIICKAWIVEFNRRMTARFGPQGWNGLWAALLWVHDEIEVAVRPEIADEARQIAIDSIRSITELFNWRIPLDGEAKLGAVWADVH